MKPSELLLSVHDFLADCGLTKAAKALAKEASLDISAEVPSRVPLLEAANDWLQRSQTEEKPPPREKKRKADDDDKKRKKKKKSTKAVSEAEKQAAALAAAEAWIPKPTESRREVAVVEETTPARFSRLGDEDRWLEKLDDKLKDNSYAATFAAEGYGAKASDKLLKVRGKDFQKNKTKMKRKNAWGGGTIDLASKSIKFEN